MTHAETPVDPYPMLTKLERLVIFERENGVFVVTDQWHDELEFTPAEVLALADELRSLAMPHVYVAAEDIDKGDAVSLDSDGKIVKAHKQEPAP